MPPLLYNCNYPISVRGTVVMHPQLFSSMGVRNTSLCTFRKLNHFYCLCGLRRAGKPWSFQPASCQDDEDFCHTPFVQIKDVSNFRRGWKFFFPVGNANSSRDAWPDQGFQAVLQTSLIFLKICCFTSTTSRKEHENIFSTPSQISLS